MSEIQAELPVQDRRTWICPLCMMPLLDYPLDSGYREHCDDRPPQRGWYLAGLRHTYDTTTEIDTGS
jgi:hypothetical protein